MIFRTVAATLLLSTFVFAQTGAPKGGHRGGFHGKPHGGEHGKPPVPPFLNNITEAGRKAFFEIVSSKDLTIAQTTAKIGEWAKTYGVTDKLNEFEAKKVAQEAEAKKSQTAVIGNLAAVQKQLDAILSNKDQTRKAQHEAIEKLKKEYPKEVAAFFSISKKSNGREGRQHGGHGHGGPHGAGHKGPKGEHNGPKKAEALIKKSA